MAYRLNWLIPGRVILLELGGIVNEDSMYECDNRVVEMLDDGDADADLIHQVLMLHEIDTSPNLRMLSHMIVPKHPRNGWLMAVGGTHRGNQFVGNLTVHLNRLRARPAASIEEALEFLYHVDPTLPRTAVNTR
jgi:hypothetical protein